MDLLTQWRDWLDAFNTACSDDNWDRLGDYLTEDASYRVVGVPFACRIEGRDNVIAGFAKSVRGFDRKFDARRHNIVATRVFDPDMIMGEVWGSYHKADAPPLFVAARGFWQYRFDKIDLMIDVWDTSLVENAISLAWLAEHGQGLDASYV